MTRIMPVTKRMRYEVLKRDNHTCRYCGGTTPDVVLTIDHVVPLALGGSSSPDNLVAACRDCNAGKSSTSPGDPLVADVKAIDMQWAHAMRRATVALSAQRRREARYLDAFHDAWMKYGKSTYSDPESVARLYRAGLPKAEMLSAVDIALFQRGVYDRFSYFMGIGWKKVTELQDAAKAILAADEAEAQ